MDMTSFFKISYGLYVVSTTWEGKENGCVVNTVVQVSAEPARLAVAVNKGCLTAELIGKAGKFNAVALTQDAPMDFIGRFGFTQGRQKDKFDRGDTCLDRSGLPYVKEHAAALFSCSVVSSLDVGTHVIYVGDVIQAENLSGGTPLTYEYYYKEKRGTTPKNAPSYRKPQPKAGG
ncbi:MAG: flavin reductase family protein [Eubacteriales bacterium]|nr:flavin reductase family protein [Eubacteriales bacterium]